MKFSMSDDEIRVSYDTAKDRKAQIRSLAELNVTTPAAMAAKLRELGCDVPDHPSFNQRPLHAHDILFDETRARELFAEGKTDLDIAEMLGIGVYAFAAWRRQNGMKRPRGRDMKKWNKKQSQSAARLSHPCRRKSKLRSRNRPRRLPHPAVIHFCLHRNRPAWPTWAVCCWIWRIGTLVSSSPSTAPLCGLCASTCG